MLFIIKIWSKIIGPVQIRFEGTTDQAIRLAKGLNGALFTYFNGDLVLIDGGLILIEI